MLLQLQLRCLEDVCIAEDKSHPDKYEALLTSTQEPCDNPRVYLNAFPEQSRYSYFRAALGWPGKMLILIEY